MTSLWITLVWVKLILARLFSYLLGSSQVVMLFKTLIPFYSRHTITLSQKVLERVEGKGTKFILWQSFNKVSLSDEICKSLPQQYCEPGVGVLNCNKGTFYSEQRKWWRLPKSNSAANVPQGSMWVTVLFPLLSLAETICCPSWSLRCQAPNKAYLLLHHPTFFGVQL